MTLLTKFLFAFTAFNVAVLLIIAWMENAALGAFAGLSVCIVGLIGYSIHMEN